MEVTKCFADFTAIPKDFLCYIAQPGTTASDPKCGHILQSDIKETVVNKSTNGVSWKETPLLQREPNESE